MARLRDESLAAMGQVDIVMNNAGVALLGPPESVPIDDWRWIIDVNILGLVRGAAAFIPHMLERGSGHIVNTASIAGLHAYSWDAIPYITSKFGAYGLSEGLFAYLKPHGVGVSVLCPGLVTTNLAETARFSGAEDRDSWFSIPERLLNNPISADSVGPMVADAVEAGQFLILTHPEDAAYLAERRADLEAALVAEVAGAPIPPLPKRRRRPKPKWQGASRQRRLLRLGPRIRPPGTVGRPGGGIDGDLGGGVGRIHVLLSDPLQHFLAIDPNLLRRFDAEPDPTVRRNRHDRQDDVVTDVDLLSDFAGQCEHGSPI